MQTSFTLSHHLSSLSLYNKILTNSFKTQTHFRNIEKPSDMEQPALEDKRNPDHDLYLENKIREDFYNFLKINEEEGDDDEEEEEEEEEFSFMCGGEEASAIGAEEAFTNGQIKTVYPLFNRDLLFSGSSDFDSLPMTPPVKNVFVETEGDNSRTTTSTGEDDEIVGPYCEWSSRKAVDTSPEVCKKSNSTGFSKIWRFKEFRDRCNSDGRDTFVFLNNTHAPKPKAPAETEKTVKVKRSGKGKTVSSHEVYLRSKAKEDDRRRSYLPYRPELMGFFTNVNTGLTRNVHPF